mgnify:FL=1
MNSQYRESRNLFLNKDRNFLNKIIDIEKFKKLDDRYIITEICKNIKLKYEITEEFCNIYYKSFTMNLTFNYNKIKRLAIFIDSKLFDKNDEEKFILFIENLEMNKNWNFPMNDFKLFLHKILNENVKEFNFEDENVSIYFGIVNGIGRELIFIMIDLNA